MFPIHQSPRWGALLLAGAVVCGWGVQSAFAQSMFGTGAPTNSGGSSGLVRSTSNQTGFSSTFGGNNQASTSTFAPLVAHAGIFLAKHLGTGHFRHRLDRSGNQHATRPIERDRGTRRLRRPVRHGGPVRRKRHDRATRHPRHEHRTIGQPEHQLHQPAKQLQ